MGRRAGRVIVGRNSFDGTVLVRERVDMLREQRGCRNCWGPGRFRYGIVDSDLGGTPDWTAGGFCSIDCYRAYDSK